MALKKTKTVKILALIILLLSIASTAIGGTIRLLEVEVPAIRGPWPPFDEVRKIVLYFFLLALGLGGLFAFISILIAGIEWIFAVGNPTMQSDARERIRGAVLGLLLLVGSYVLLYTINPDLVRLREPGVGQLPAGAVPRPPGGGVGGE